MPKRSPQSIEDELEIQNLISELALISDNGTSDEYAALFAPDGIWRMDASPEVMKDFAPRHGREAIKKGLEGSRAKGLGGRGSNARHIITNVRLRMDGDQAFARSYMTYLENSNAAVKVTRFAVYEDKFVRTPEGWKLGERVVQPG